MSKGYEVLMDELTLSFVRSHNIMRSKVSADRDTTYSFDYATHGLKCEYKITRKARGSHKGYNVSVSLYDTESKYMGGVGGTIYEQGEFDAIMFYILRYFPNNVRNEESIHYAEFCPKCGYAMGMTYDEKSRCTKCSYVHDYNFSRAFSEKE